MRRNILNLLFLTLLLNGCVQRYHFNDIGISQLHLIDRDKITGSLALPSHSSLSLNPLSKMNLIGYKVALDSNLKYKIDYTSHKNAPEDAVFDTIYRNYQFKHLAGSEKNMPSEFLNYMPNYIYPMKFGYFKLINVQNNETLNYDCKQVKPRFPDSLECLATTSTYIDQIPIFKGCSMDCDFFNAYESDTLMLRYEWHGQFKCLNPASEYFMTSIVAIWEKDYGAYIYCRRMNSEDFKFFEFLCKEEVDEEFLSSRKFAKLKNREIDRAKRKIIKSNVNDENLAMHKSYFQLILWSLYRPEEFTVPFNFGKYRSLNFTSNNPEYAGEYKVKFNIYKPYYFKVYKR